MKRRNLSKAAIKFASISAGCLVATQTLAFMPDSSRALAIKTATARPSTYLPTTKFYSADGVTREYDKQSNAVRYLSGSEIFGLKIQSTNPADFEKAALNAVMSHKSIFGLDHSEVRLNAKATLVSGPDAAVSFHVFRDGMRIQDAGITFHFKKGSLILVKNESFAEATLSLAGSFDTGAVAAEAVGGSGFVGRGSMFRVKATDAGYSLVKVDEYVVTRDQTAYVVQVDSTDGSVFDLRTKNFELRGSAVGKIYPRYFGESLVDAGLGFSRPEHTSSDANERGEFSTIDDITAPVLKGLRGKYVTIKNLQGYDLEATGSKVDGQWLINFEIAANTEQPWDNGDVAQTMAYVNTNKVIQTAKRYINPSWFDKPLGVNVNNRMHCNAYWDGDTINLFSAGESRGITCANTGVISDVLFHEWGHGLDDNTGGIDDSALSEGFGDAVSMFMTGDPKIGVDFMPIERKPVRDLTEKRVFPKDVVHEPHKDGLIVAGAWYDLYVALQAEVGAAKAKDLMGKFLFKGIYQFAKMTDVYKATLALDDDNASLTDGSPHLCLINKAFLDHGLATKDSRCESN